jgi:hypothetical protein
MHPEQGQLPVPGKLAKASICNPLATTDCNKLIVERSQLLLDGTAASVDTVTGDGLVAAFGLPLVMMALVCAGTLNCI